MLHQRQDMLLCGAVRQAAGVAFRLKHAAARQGQDVTRGTVPQVAGRRQLGFYPLLPTCGQQQLGQAGPDSCVSPDHDKTAQHLPNLHSSLNTCPHENTSKVMDAAWFGH